MNPWTQVGITVGATVLANLIMAVYIYGQLTQKVTDHTGWLKRHESVLEKHGGQLLNHEKRISHIEGRKGIPLDAEQETEIGADN